MPYFGELSENSYKLPNRATKPHVRAWMADLARQVSEVNVPKCKRYVVGIRGYFPSESRPDIPNLYKVTLDAVEDGLGINDKHFTARDDGYELGHVKPYLRITVEGVENE